MDGHQTPEERLLRLVARCYHLLVDQAEDGDTLATCRSELNEAGYWDDLRPRFFQGALGDTTPESGYG